MNLSQLLSTAFAAALLCSVGAYDIQYDKVHSFAQPKPATVSEKLPSTSRRVSSLKTARAARTLLSMPLEIPAEGWNMATRGLKAARVKSGLASVWPGCLAQRPLGYHVRVVLPQGLR